MKRPIRDLETGTYNIAGKMFKKEKTNHIKYFDNI